MPNIILFDLDQTLLDRNTSLIKFVEWQVNFFQLVSALLHKDLKGKAPLIEPNLRRNLGKWST
ncbi:hypothetical protein DBQ26_13000 [Acinetobacter pittii]|nr:hypothetical protein DBQ26_13000 [Acinetobacter pittii]